MAKAKIFTDNMLKNIYIFDTPISTKNGRIKTSQSVVSYNVVTSKLKGRNPSSNIRRCYHGK